MAAAMIVEEGRVRAATARKNSEFAQALRRLGNPRLETEAFLAHAKMALEAMSGTVLTRGLFDGLPRFDGLLFIRALRFCLAGDLSDRPHVSRIAKAIWRLRLQVPGIAALPSSFHGRQEYVDLDRPVSARRARQGGDADEIPRFDVAHRRRSDAEHLPFRFKRQRGVRSFAGLERQVDPSRLAIVPRTRTVSSACAGRISAIAMKAAIAAAPVAEIDLGFIAPTLRWCRTPLPGGLARRPNPKRNLIDIPASETQWERLDAGGASRLVQKTSSRIR
jgi:hypothetical protein